MSTKTHRELGGASLTFCPISFDGIHKSRMSNAQRFLTEKACKSVSHIVIDPQCSWLLWKRMTGSCQRKNYWKGIISYIVHFVSRLLQKKWRPTVWLVLWDVNYFAVFSALTGICYLWIQIYLILLNTWCLNDMPFVWLQVENNFGGLLVPSTPVVSFCSKF